MNVLGSWTFHFVLFQLYYTYLISQNQTVPQVDLGVSGWTYLAFYAVPAFSFLLFLPKK